MSVLVANSNNDYETERKCVQRLIDDGCQALVVYPVVRNAETFRSDYLKTEHTDFPIVLVDIAYPEQARPQVVFNNYQAGFDMTQMLISEGHSRIIFTDRKMQGDVFPMNRSAKDRYSGYQDALCLAGLRVRSEDLWKVAPADTAEDIAEHIAPLLKEWMSESDRATALIALDDSWAVKTIRVAQRLGISVPEELFVVGFDNLSVAREFHPAFPTTKPDFGQAGELAARVALQMNRHKQNSPYAYMMPVPILRRDLAYEKILSNLA